MKYFSVSKEKQRQNVILLMKVKEKHKQKVQDIILDYDLDHLFWPIVRKYKDDVDTMRLEFRKALIKRELVLNELISVF